MLNPNPNDPQKTEKKPKLKVKCNKKTKRSATRTLAI